MTAAAQPQSAAPYPTSPIGLNAGADERTAIVDALLRFGAGQDLGDAALFHSSFSDDATLDFTQPAARLGVALPVFETREGIAAAILPVVARLDTTHTVSNARVQQDSADHAGLFALVEAMHLPRGDGSRSLLLKNFYWCDVVREAGTDADADGPLWKLRHVRIHNVWWQGDAGVLFG